MCILSQPDWKSNLFSQIINNCEIDACELVIVTLLYLGEKRKSVLA